MSKPAKDKAELVEQVALAILDYGVINNTISTLATSAIAAIRAAGWAVVPVTLIEQAVEELEEMNDSHYHHREKYPDEQRRYERDMELPRAIRAMFAAAPGVKP